MQPFTHLWKHQYKRRHWGSVLLPGALLQGRQGQRCFHSSSGQSQAGNKLTTAPVMAHAPAGQFQSHSTQETTQLNSAHLILYRCEQTAINSDRKDNSNVFLFLYTSLPNKCNMYFSGRKIQGIFRDPKHIIFKDPTGLWNSCSKICLQHVLYHQELRIHRLKRRQNTVVLLSLKQIPVPQLVNCYKEVRRNSKPS